MARVNSVAAAAAGVILLGAGFGLGVIVAGAGPRSEKVVKYIASGDRSAGAVAVPAPAPSPSPSPSPAPASAPAPGAAAAARALLDALPPPAFPEGTGIVTGRVVREDGTPLPGVLASLSPERPPGIGPARTMWDPEPDLEATVVESALQSRWYREARKTANSDGDGRFRFDGVADVGHGLQLRLRGWRVQPKDWKLARRVRPGADLEFTAFPQIEWTVEVVRADGSVPEEAEIRLSAGGNDLQRMNWSPGAVLYVKPGSFQASATAGDKQELKSEPQAVVLSQGTEPPALRFVVRGSPGIRGKVVLEGYTSTRGVEIALARIPPDGKADPALLSGAAALRETVWPDRDGEFLFGELAPGRYLLGASVGRRSAALVMEEVEVAGDLVTRDLRISGLDAAGFAVIHVRGPGGGPVEVTGMTTGYISGTSSSSGGGSWLRRADGAYLVEHQDTSGIGGGGGAAAPENAIWWVEVQTAAHGSRREEYRRGPDTRLTVAFEEPASLDLVVTGIKGSPLEGVLQASLVNTTESSRFVGSRGRASKLDAEGRMTLPGLQPGDYVLVLTTAGDRSGMRVLARVPVTVRAGRNPLAVPVPVLHRVTVSGVDGSARLSKKGEAFWTMSGTADAEGRVAFDGLPEGAYQVQCGQKSAEFDLPGTAEVRL